jgi:hypothetical protein
MSDLLSIIKTLLLVYPHCHFQLSSPIRWHTVNIDGDLTRNYFVGQVQSIDELIAYVQRINFHNYSYVSKNLIIQNPIAHHTFGPLTLEFRAHVGSVNEDFTRAGLRGVHLNNENIARYYYDLWPHIREIRRTDFRGDHFNI